MQSSQLWVWSWILFLRIPLTALSIFNPAAFTLIEVLKQQLATARRFIESSRQLHSSMLRSLEPPDYRYTTLEDTREVKLDTHCKILVMLSTTRTIWGNNNNLKLKRVKIRSETGWNCGKWHPRVFICSKPLPVCEESWHFLRVLSGCTMTRALCTAVMSLVLQWKFL